MTTRANAYTYIRNIKQIPIVSRNYGSPRFLCCRAGPIAPLRRLRRDLHTTRRASTTVTVGNNGGHGRIRGEDHRRLLSRTCVKSHNVSATAYAEPVAGPSFDQSAQNSETTGLEQRESPDHDDNPKHVQDEEFAPFIPGSRRLAEFSVFLLLIDKEILRLSYEPEKGPLGTKCSISFYPNDTEPIPDVHSLHTLKKVSTNKAYREIFLSLRQSPWWEEMQSDTWIKSALSNTLPTVENDSSNQINLSATEFYRFWEMRKQKLFRLRISPLERNDPHEFVSHIWLLRGVSGKSKVSSTGRAKAGLYDILVAEAEAHMLMIAELQLNGQWEELVSAIEAVEESSSNPTGETASNTAASYDGISQPLKEQAASGEENVSDNLTSTEGSNPENEQLSAVIEKALDSRGSIKFTADDDLLDMMGFYRHDLLEASKVMETAKSKLGPNFGRHLSKSKEVIPLRGGELRSTELKESLKKIRESESPEMLDIRSKVADLPISSYKESVLELVNNNPFSIIVAETGSGKSTQVPQMILDDAIDKGFGSDCNILCTQPRRLAAYRLADRVAKERNEVIGNTIGYIVRHRRQVSVRNTHITFCTTGILLNILQGSFKNVQSFSHIIIDEVHVRDIGIDFVMLLLKRYIQSTLGKGEKVPRITIMSATVDTDLFASYFDLKRKNMPRIPAPHLNIPGRQFHVHHHYLDEIMTNIKSSPHADKLKELLDETDSEKFLKRHYAVFGEQTSNTSATEESSDSSVSSLRQTMLGEEDPHIPCGLYTAAILNILSSTSSGSIVCFLPGLRQIMQVQERLMSHGPQIDLDMSDEKKFRIGILHSQVPDEQEKLGLEVPEGCRRIILSTDIAEASITIPDVKYVVDSGKVNQLLVDQKKHSNRLASCWATQSNAKQRAGRVGRVQDGEYFFLGTKQRYDTLRITQTPEILRGDLQDTCLRAKVFTGTKESISSFLRQTLEPPNPEEVLANVNSLKQLSALDDSERVTPLGHLLTELPLPPHLGKLVVLGIIFRCLDPLLILASSSSTPIFLRSTNPTSKKQVQESSLAFAEGSSSDHIATLNAFKAVRQEYNQNGYHASKRFAVDNCIWYRSYEMTLRTARQIYQQLLTDRLIIRYVPKSESDSENQFGFGGASLNVNSHHVPLIKSLLLHCLFPRLAGPSPKSWKFATDFDPRTMMYPRSVAMAGRPIKKPPKSLAIYSSKVETAAPEPFLLENTLVSPLMASLFGGRLVWDGSELLMDSWLGLEIGMEKVLVGKDEVARNLIEMQKAVNLALDAAYSSLSCGIPQPLHPGKRKAFLESQNSLHTTLSESVIGLLARDRDPSVAKPFSFINPDVWEDTYFSVDDAVTM